MGMIRRPWLPDHLSLFLIPKYPNMLVFTNIFNLSLAQAIVPNYFKTATVVPVPKHAGAMALNDFCPVAFIIIIAKCLDRLVLSHLKNCLTPTLDPYQFAYKSNRSTEDAIASALHFALTHLDRTSTYVRHFSSASDTAIPSKLISKLFVYVLIVPKLIDLQAPPPPGWCHLPHPKFDLGVLGIFHQQAGCYSPTPCLWSRAYIFLFNIFNINMSIKWLTKSYCFQPHIPLLKISNPH